MAAEYERVAIQALRRNPHDPEAWTQWGQGLFDEGHTLPSSDAMPLFAEAARKFAVAKDLRPREAQYWLNVAVATHNQAVRTSLPDSIELLRSTEKCYGEAARLQPREHLIWHAWGKSLFALACRMEDKQLVRQQLYQADIRFAVADEIDPEHTENLSVWGTSLLQQATLESGEDASPLFRASAEKFAMIAQKTPNDASAWSKWWLCLYEEARLCKDKSQAVALYKRCLRKLEIALELEPYNSKNWSRSGEVFARLAELTDTEEKRFLLANASKRFERATQLDPDNADAWTTWANALYYQAEFASESECLYLYQESVLRYSIAAEIEPDQNYIFGNWGMILSIQAMHSSPDQARSLLAKALVQLEKADTLQPDSGFNCSNHAFALLILAGMSQGEEKKILLDQATLKSERATELEPKSHAAWWNRSAVCIERATEAAGDDRTKLLNDAAEMLKEVERMEEHSSHYGYAAIAALQGELDRCRTLLYSARKRDPLRTWSYMRQDKAFASVRNEPWFATLINGLPR